MDGCVCVCVCVCVWIVGWVMGGWITLVTGNCKYDLLRDQKAHSAEFAEPLCVKHDVFSGTSSTNSQHTIAYQKKRVIKKKSLKDVCGSPSWTI